MIAAIHDHNDVVVLLIQESNIDLEAVNNVCSVLE
jgi:hypothetical protein